MYHELVTELIYIIPYSLMGAALGYAYLKSGQNVICSIIAHLINNALSIILTLIAFSVII
jgi:membrane protease YdiL (CAAX protease family)